MTNPIARFEPAGRLRRELDRLVDDLFSAPGDNHSAWSPALDVTETDGAYLATFDLPGLGPDDVEVSVEDGVLTVRGEREKSASSSEGGVVRSERSYGAFYRAIQLPRGAQAEGAEATFDKGVLSVRVPKAEQSQPHRIAVTGAAVTESGDGSAEPAPALDAG